MEMKFTMEEIDLMRSVFNHRIETLENRSSDTDTEHEKAQLRATIALREKLEVINQKILNGEGA